MKLPTSFRWKIDGGTLGEGGQAAVVSVVHTDGAYTGRFALKSLARNKPPKAYERFSREVEAMKAVDHPNVAKLIDCSAPSDEFQFYVMEYIEGARPLKKVIGTRENPFFDNALLSVQFFKQLASAIGAWEEVGIVHRDLSLGNVLLLPNGDIKVIDFGICQIDNAETITLDDEGVGTQNYMAPECESGAGGHATIASDLYSAGKLLWSVITNQVAFSREQPAFNAKALSVVMPSNWKASHLHHIFEDTIRHNPSDRVATAGQAMQRADQVEYLILCNYRPLEQLNSHCPLCGIGRMRSSESGVFGNPIPSGYIGMACAYCGFSFPLNQNTWRKSNADRAKLT